MSKSSKEDFFASLFSYIGYGILLFVLGAYVTEFKIFPYPQLLEKPFLALKASQEKEMLSKFNPATSNFWVKVDRRFSKRGLISHNREEAMNGYTLISAGNLSVVSLIDMSGTVKHQWSISWRDAYKDLAIHVSDPVPEHSIRLTGGHHLYGNGDLLSVFTAVGDTPYGYGLIKMDKDSNPLWVYPAHVHHQLSVNSDGSIWVLEHDFRDLSKRPLDMPGGNEGIVLEDFASLLSSDGELINRFSILDVIQKTPDKHYLLETLLKNKVWDISHANSIQAVNRQFSSHHDFASTGDLLISLRTQGSLLLVDPANHMLKYSLEGFWKMQHDPDPLDSGRMLIFDNQGYRGARKLSRVVEFDPKTNKGYWQFMGSESDPFYSMWGGAQQPLPNGNVLIVDAMGGSRILEVSRENKIVWEFRTPATINLEGDLYVSTLGGAVKRVLGEELNFAMSPPKDGGLLYKAPEL